MKKLILTIIVCIGVMSARAGWNSSELNLRMFDNSLFTVIFDGYNYGQLSSAFTVADLRPGNHFMKVYRYCKPFRWSHGYNELVYSGYVRIKPSTVLNGMISRDFRLIILSEFAIEPVNPGPRIPGGYYDDQYNTNDNGSGGYVADYMSDYDFGELKNLVANTTFDDTKVKVCKQAISSNYICSAQLCELMSLLTFESNKLDLAKSAYPRVVDKNKFYLVNSAFTFSSSVDELNEYINGR